MNCERFERIIDSYLDSQLSGSLLAEFHAHRLSCRRCSRVVSMLQAAGDVIAQDQREPKISADFADRVLAAMPQAQKVNRSVWIMRLGAGAAGLAAAAAIILAVFVSSQSQPHAILGKLAVIADPGVQTPEDSTLLDGKVVRDAVERVVSWYEVDRTGQ
jgi:anti-sigma factor RsiW